MMAELIDRRAKKAEAKTILADAQVSPKAVIALYMGLITILNLVATLAGAPGILSTFVTILTSLMALVLQAGLILYFLRIRRGERVEFLTLFDGFSFVGKIILLSLMMYVFVFLWSLLFVVPGLVALYRYRFALYNLCENPELTPKQALDMSIRQTMGYKGQLLALDLSYLGWTILALLPALIYNYYASLELLAAAESYVFAGALTAASASFSVTSLMPAWAWSLVIGLWQMVVSIFYLANFQCVELSFFETAKRTSGVGAGEASHPGF